MAKSKLNDTQRNLLSALREDGGCYVRPGLIVAEGQWWTAATGLLLFCLGLIVSDGTRVTLTDAGKAVLED
jgi:hypothetical protein